MYAIFGDSFITRLEDFNRGDIRLDGHRCNFYGVSGMSTTRKFRNKFEEMLRDRPRYVFINLGGNDIIDGCRVEEIVKNLENIVKTLRERGVKRIFIASIIERGSFPTWTGMNRTRFNKIRRSVNEKLKSKFCDDFVNICRKMRFPKHYDRDQIHPGFREGGLIVLGCLIRHSFRRTYVN